MSHLEEQQLKLDLILSELRCKELYNVTADNLEDHLEKGRKYFAERQEQVQHNNTSNKLLIGVIILTSLSVVTLLLVGFSLR